MQTKARLPHSLTVSSMYLFSFFQTPLVFTPLSAELALQLGRMANFELLFYVIRLNKPISQSCTVAKSENSGGPLNNQNLADRMED